MEGKILGLDLPRIWSPGSPFDKHPMMKKLPEKIQEAMKSLWGLQNKVFKYMPFPRKSW